MDEEWYDYVVVLMIALLTLLILNFVQIKAETRSTCRAILFVILFPGIIVVMPTMLLMYPFLYFYRTFLSIRLRGVYRETFYGLLDGLDVPLLHPIKKNGMIGGVIIVGIDTNVTNKNVLDYVQEFVVENILTNKHLAKLRTSVRWYGGYPFLVNIYVKSKDCVRELPTVKEKLDDATLMKLLGQWHHLPFSGPLMWDVMVGTQPLQRKQSSNSSLKQYPIMIRVHHGLADAVTIMQLVAGVFGEKFWAGPVTPIEKHPEAQDYVIARLFQFIGQIACVMVYFPSILYLCTSKETARNQLHVRKMGDKENIAVEFDDNGTYFQKLKKIRNYTGATVPEIISTAYTQSLKEHFLKYKKEREDHFTFLFPISHDYGMQSRDVKDLQFRNRIGILTFAMPFSIENEADYDPNVQLYSRLSVMKRKTNALKKSIELQVSTMIYYFIAPVFPFVYLYFFSHLTNYTSIISQMPGLPRGSYCNGALHVTDSAFWISHLFSIDVSLGFILCNDRLTVSFSCDSSCMSHEMAQEIVHNLYSNIDSLEKEAITR